MELPGSNGGFGLLENAQIGAEQGRLRALAGRAGGEGETREGLQKAAREFEAVFLNQLMKAMRQTVPENELFNSQGATKFYRQMHDQEMARALATGRSGLGVADLIVQQLERSVARGEAAAPAPQGERAGPPAPVGPRPGTVPLGPPAPDAAAAATRPAAPARPTAIPAAPLPATRAPAEAAARYRALDQTAGRTAALARLRLLADREGTAAADTLARHGGHLAEAARETDLPPALLLAMVVQESGGNPQAVSPKGARGLMQLMPGTAAELGVADPADPAQNLRGGATYLARMLERYEGRLDLALAAYNAGPGAVDRAGRAVPQYAETRRYVRQVLDRFGRLGGGTELANGD